jgi:hypothetical protein
MQRDLSDEPLNGYTSDEQLVALLEGEIIRRESRAREHNLIATLYPDSGVLARDRYPQHLAFFRGGATYKERLFGAGKRAGKTTAGSFEMPAISPAVIRIGGKASASLVPCAPGRPATQIP